MPRRYKKKGYTECQLEIADWIKLGHTHMRDDPQLRCYACNGKTASSNYPYVKNLTYNGRDMGGGWVYLEGQGAAGLRPGDRLIDQVRHSGTCGLVIFVHDMILRKESIIAYYAGGGR